MVDGPVWQAEGATTTPSSSSKSPGSALQQQQQQPLIDAKIIMKWAKDADGWWVGYKKGQSSWGINRILVFTYHYH